MRMVQYGRAAAPLYRRLRCLYLCSVGTYGLESFAYAVENLVIRDGDAITALFILELWEKTSYTHQE